MMLTFLRRAVEFHEKYRNDSAKCSNEACLNDEFRFDDSLFGDKKEKTNTLEMLIFGVHRSFVMRLHDA